MSKEKRAYVAVVDDDESVRESLPDLLREFGFDSDGFASAEEFLDSDRARRADCLVLDMAMPGISGLELQSELRRQKCDIPIVFITAHGDEAVSQQARQGGAVDCLLKPFTDTTLFDAMQAALKRK